MIWIVYVRKNDDIVIKYLKTGKIGFWRRLKHIFSNSQYYIFRSIQETTDFVDFALHLTNEKWEDFENFITDELNK